MKQLLAVLFAITFALAACSGDDDDDAARSTTTTTEAEGDVASTDDDQTSTTIPEPNEPPEDPTGTGLVCEVVGEPVAVANISVDIDATDFEFIVNATRLSDGDDAFVSFVNNGDGPHEVQIVELDDPADLPLETNGRVDLDAIDELPKLGPIGGGDSCEGTYQLDPGTYVLFSNLVTEDGENYLDLGMVATFTVE